MSTAIVPADLEEQLHKHETVVANLRAQRNSYFPALRIPPEILGHIFTLGARQHYESHKNGPPFGVVPDWIRATYVCSYWRSVALNCSTPWKYHFVVSHAWTDALLARSKHSSLRISVSWSSRKNNTWWSILVKTLLDHMDRIQELRLRLSERVVFPLRISFRAPRLQVMDIEGGRGPFVRTYTRVYESDTPLLHTLKFNQSFFQWWRRSLSLGQVTTFYLCNALSRVDIMDLLPALSQMKALKVLRIENTLENAFNLLSSGALDSFSKIDLPCLARLFVAARVTAVVAFLFCVNIPLKAFIRLEIRGGSRTVDEYAQLPIALEQAFSQSTISSLVIRFLSVHPFALYASEHDICDIDLSTDYIPSPDRHRISLAILIDKMAWLVIRRSNPIANNICCALSSNRHIPSLHVINPPFLSDFWMVISNRFHGLRHMKLSSNFMPDMASLLAIPADEPLEEDGDLGPKYFPALEGLTLYRMSFVSDLPVEMGVISFKSLQDALKDRKGPRVELAMIDCDTDASILG